MNAERKVVGSYLERDEEETTKDQDTPDGDVGHDFSGQRVLVYRNSAVPVYGNESPSQGT